MLRENDGRGATGIGEITGVPSDEQATNFRKFRNTDTAPVRQNGGKSGRATGGRLALFLGLCFLVVPAATAAGSSTPDSQTSSGIRGKLRLRRATNVAASAKACLISRGSDGNPEVRLIATDAAIMKRGATGDFKNHLVLSSTGPGVAIYLDQHEKVLAIHSEASRNDATGAMKAGSYRILDADGRVTLELKSFNDQTRPAPSPSGDFAVGWPELTTPGGPPIFYDKDGVRNKWAHGLSGDGWPLGRYALGARFSPNGKIVAVFSAIKSGGDKSTTFFDARGTELWRLPTHGEIVFSQDASKVAFIEPSVVRVFDAKGRQISTAQLHSEKGGMRGVFSRDAARLLVGSGDGKLNVFDVSTGGELWSWDLKSLPHPSTSQGGSKFDMLGLAADDTLSSIAIVERLWGLREIAWSSGRKSYEHAVTADRVVVLRQSSVLDELSLPPDSFASASLAPFGIAASIKMSSTGNVLVLGLRDRVATYDIGR